MKTLDPSIRQAAQRVTAWHVARWRAHLAELAAETLPPEDGAEPTAPESEADAGSAARPESEPSQHSLAS